MDPYSCTTPAPVPTPRTKVCDLELTSAADEPQGR